MSRRNRENIKDVENGGKERGKKRHMNWVKRRKTKRGEYKINGELGLWKECREGG